MISNKKSQEIELHCLKTVSHMFATFHNPNLRGSNFSWETFASSMRDLFQAQILVSISSHKKQEKEIQELAGELAFHQALNLVTAMIK